MRRVWLGDINEWRTKTKNGRDAKQKGEKKEQCAPRCLVLCVCVCVCVCLCYVFVQR